jgi:toxin ParE1/3/4
MARVDIKPQAQEDLLEIWQHIAQSSLDNATKWARTINDKCQLLAQMPGIGRFRHDLIINLRSFPVGRYVIFYQETAEGIEVVRVLHGSRDLPGVFDEMLDL